MVRVMDRLKITQALINAQAILIQVDVLLRSTNLTLPEWAKVEEYMEDVKSNVEAILKEIDND